MMPTPVPPSPSERAIPKVLFKGRMVSGKKSNSPFFVHQRHKQNRHPATITSPSSKSSFSSSLFTEKWLYSKALLARLLFHPLRYALLVLLISLLLSRIITEHWLWGYEGKYARLRYYFPGPSEEFTIERLAQHDGIQEPDKPLLLAIKGVVYNVDANKAMYGPGGSYHHFVGKDASRAFVTGCFKSGLSSDLRGLSPKQIDALEYWANFFENSSRYFPVGTLRLPDLSNSPIPVDCDPRTEGGAL